MRGYDVDVGLIEQAERNKKGEYSRNQLEIDFVCNQGSERCYIQVAYSLPTPEKKTSRGASLAFASRRLQENHDYERLPCSALQRSGSALHGPV